MPQPSIHLVLFLSRATPLKKWDQMGILQRELAIYQSHLNWLSKLSIITSGGKEELFYQQYIPGVEILYNHWKFSPNAYSLLAPWLHSTALKKASIYKTNQLDGAWTAIFAGKRYRKPVIVRAGYLWAEFNQLFGRSHIKTNLIKRLQSFSLSEADAIFLTTKAMKREILLNHNINSSKFQIIPNTIDTNLFHPHSEVKPIPGRACFVGRLTKQKNLTNLIEAMASIDESHLVLIGEGPLQPSLSQTAQENGGRVSFLGQLPNHQIPLEINLSEVFVLPSVIEGHPKALLEAMACGAAIIGTDVPGTRELIEHGKTGWLCPPTIEGLGNAIRFLLSNPLLRCELGNNARQFILDHFSLEKVSQLEKEAIENVYREFNIES